MVANNREDFLFQLHNELHRIGVDASSEIFSDFEEHFKASANALPAASPMQLTP